MPDFHVGVMTISDRCSIGETVDRSGQLLRSLALNHLPGCLNVITSLVPDDFHAIETDMIRMVDKLGVQLLLTTGGTGFSERDVTPEVTRKLIEKEAPQLMLAMSLMSFEKTKFAALSRAVCGIRHKTLIVNFPGSPKAVEECFMAIVDVLPHAIDLIAGEQDKVEQVHDANGQYIDQHICPHKTNSGAADDRNSPYPMIAVETALNTILDAVQRIEFNYKDYKSPINIPEFRASIKDGYAVKANGSCLGVKKVIGYISAGDDVIHDDFDRGKCYKINTGAPVPDFASAVVQVEDTKLISTEDDVEKEVEILIEPTVGLDIRPVGCDLKKGDRLFKANKDFPDIVPFKSILASVGIVAESIPHDEVKICILSTGDELVAPGGELEGGKIFDSNTTMLKALLRQHDFNTVTTHVVGDTFDSMHETIKSLSEENSFIICSGGVSMGDKDFLKPVLEALNYDLHFGRVNMKPGKPMTFASHGDNYVFGLPGNPVSAFTTFHLFILPALRKRCGYNKHKLSLPVIQAELVNEKILLDPRPEYARAKILSRNGKFYAEITDNQMSSRLTSIEGADVLLHLPPRTNDRKFVRKGMKLKASTLKHHFISEYLD